ncbi:hypothetical protein [Kitasatospora sp. NBC_01266]|uniref:hypothetical protein n=1 Tax=Kitasatospora sp. NBC_01266 TaxID=2903572 RepID=UPI002E35E600|nr:hypothetical protein [Kitasatospora sp. NBC_01266]
MAADLSDRSDVKTADVLRFSTELIGWVAAPWALGRGSILLAILAPVVLIGLPAVLATPGDKKQVLVPIPGWGTIGLVLLELGAAVAGAWVIWPAVVAVLVTVLAAACAVAELPRWRRLLGMRATPDGS